MENMARCVLDPQSSMRHDEDRKLPILHFRGDILDRLNLSVSFDQVYQTYARHLSPCDSGLIIVRRWTIRRTVLCIKKIP